MPASARRTRAEVGPALRTLFVALVSLLPVAWPRAARAEDVSKAQCATAYERAQEHRAAGRLRKAREALVLCAQQECPSFVQADCLEWLPDVEREVPSVVIVARGPDGADTGSVRVLMDDELLTDHLDGTALDVDPGYHQFRFEYEDQPPIERRLLIRQTQKNRAIEVSFQVSVAPRPPPPTEPSVTPPPAADEPEPEPPSPLRPYAFVAGGVGAAGLVGFTVLGVVGRNERNHLEETCKGHCPQADVDAVRTKYVIANIALGVGIAGLATGAILYVLSEPRNESSGAARSFPAIGVAPLFRGATLSVDGRF